MINAAVLKNNSTPQNNVSISVPGNKGQIIDLTDPEKVADYLLEEAGFIGKEHGLYTEAQLNRKIRLDHQKLKAADEYGLTGGVVDYLVSCRVDDIIDVSRMTQTQEICYRLYIDGLSNREIAKAAGVNIRIVAFHLRAAKRKVRRACREGKYAGWYEVYLQEVNKPVYRKKRIPKE